jgi:hypothetical protein
MMRIVTAPAIGARYNTLFRFRRPADLITDRNLTLAAITEAVLSSSDAERALASRAGLQLKQHGGRLYRELCDSSNHLQFLCQAEFFRSKLLFLLQFGDRATDLASCHWEALYDERADTFLGHAGTVARYIPAGQTDRTTSRTLRVLVAISTYGTGGAIDDQMVGFAKDDLGSLRRSLQPVDELWNPSPRQLAAALHSGVNVFHFFGHGGVCHNQGPYLMLSEEDVVGSGNSQQFVDGRKIRGRRAYFDALSNIFNYAETRELRLVVLNACQLEEQAALGSKLVGRYGIPGVITMRARVGTQVIADRYGFTESLYREIAKGRAVHEAYRAGLSSILYRSPIETFVPTLTLGTTEPLILVDPILQAGWSTAMLSSTGTNRHPPEEKR